MIQLDLDFVLENVRCPEKFDCFLQTDDVNEIGPDGYTLLEKYLLEACPIKPEVVSHLTAVTGFKVRADSQQDAEKWQYILGQCARKQCSTAVFEQLLELGIK